MCPSLPSPAVSPLLQHPLSLSPSLVSQTWKTCHTRHIFRVWGPPKPLLPAWHENASICGHVFMSGCIPSPLNTTNVSTWTCWWCLVLPPSFLPPAQHQNASTEDVFSCQAVFPPHQTLKMCMNRHVLGVWWYLPLLHLPPSSPTWTHIHRGCIFVLGWILSPSWTSNVPIWAH